MAYFISTIIQRLNVTMICCLHSYLKGNARSLRDYRNEEFPLPPNQVQRVRILSMGSLQIPLPHFFPDPNLKNDLQVHVDANPMAHPIQPQFGTQQLDKRWNINSGVVCIQWSPWSPKVRFLGTKVEYSGHWVCWSFLQQVGARFPYS